MISDLTPANHAAGDLGSCVLGRLRVEIIGIAMDDHSSSNDILYSESVCSHYQLGVALLLQKERQITGVAGMGSAIGIIVVPV